jgi:Fe-S cluster assembly protein SufD
MSTENYLQHYAQSYQQYAQHLAGKQATWLQQLREDNMQNFLQKGFPGKKQEDWKYTRLTQLEATPFQLMPKPERVENTAQLATQWINDLDAYRIVFVDGIFQTELSNFTLQQVPFTLLDLPTALQTKDKALQTLLTQKLAAHNQAFTALNTALMNTGIYLHIPAATRLDKPIYCVYLSTAQTSPSMQHMRNIVIAEADAEVCLLEHYVGLPQAVYFNNSITQVHAHAAAKIQHYKLQEESQQALHIATTFVTQQQHSHVASHTFTLGSQLARSDMHVALTESHAHCDLYGLYVTDKQQHVDHHTVIHHQQPLTTSMENYKGILDGQSRAVFNGQIIVDEQAQQVTADQANKNLLLSRDVEIDTKPQLEIYADDVKCSHGAAIGQLDDKALFYLRSRGVDAATARAVLQQAFAQEIIDTVSMRALAQWITPRVTQESLELG